MDHAFWTNLWQNLMHLGTPDSALSPTTLLEKLVRPVAVYLVLLFGLRLFGRRILAQLNSFDLVVLLTLSNTVQNAIIGNDTSLFGGVIGVVMLFATNAVVLRLFYRGPQRCLRGEDGGDVMLISDGKPNDAMLARFHMNRTELLVKAHERGFDSLEEIERGVLSPVGNLYFHGKRSVASDARMDEVLRRLDSIQRELATMKR